MTSKPTSVSTTTNPGCEHVWKPDIPYCLKCKLPARQKSLG